MTAAWTDWLAAAPGSFLVGVLVGFLASNRYRITRRNGGTSGQS